MGALASRTTVPFIYLQSSYKITLRWKKTKCTKAGHENPYTPAGGKNGPDHAERCDSRGFTVYCVKSVIQKYVTDTKGGTRIQIKVKPSVNMTIHKN